MDTIGERIKALRKQNNMSQKELGDIVGLHNSNIGRIENGSVYPTTDVLRKISNHFNVSCDWLVNGSLIETDICNNADETRLLYYYRLLSNSDKTEVQDLIDFKLYKDNQRKSKDESKSNKD